MWFFALYFNEKVCFSLPTPFFLRSSTGFFFVGFPELGFSHSAGTNGGGKKKRRVFIRRCGRGKNTQRGLLVSGCYGISVVWGGVAAGYVILYVSRAVHVTDVNSSSSPSTVSWS